MDVFAEAEELGIEIDPDDTEATVREVVAVFKWQAPLLVGIDALQDAVERGDRVGAHREAVELARASAVRP